MQIASWMVTVTVVIKKYAVIIFVFSYYKISIEEITSWLYLQIQSLLLRYLRLKLCLNSYIYIYVIIVNSVTWKADCALADFGRKPPSTCGMREANTRASLRIIKV